MRCEMNKILFSPIGGTDPITNFRDGAMLHITRVYQPDRIILFLSKEMVDFHRKDNRYLFCIEQLGEKLGRKFNVTVIENEDLVEVQRFDYFYQEFRDIIRNVKMENPESNVLLNISSGTPAMKGALHTLSVLSEFSEHAIQVSTPHKKLNEIHEDRNEYDAEFLWEYNEDNASEFINRCYEEKGMNLFSELQKDNVKKHISVFDYQAARRISEEMDPHHITLKAKDFIIAAEARQRLDIRTFDKIMHQYSTDFTPIKEGDKRPIYEFVLGLRLKLIRKEYADYIRAISPVISDLLLLSLKKFAGIDIKNYIYRRETGDFWNIDALRKNPELYKALTEITDKITYVSTHQLSSLMDRFCHNPVVRNSAAEVREVEIKVRNIAAHEIISIDESFIKTKTGHTPEKILKLILGLMQANQIDVKDDQMTIYERMNDYIVTLL